MELGAFTAGAMSGGKTIIRGGFEPSPSYAPSIRVGKIAITEGKINKVIVGSDNWLRMETLLIKLELIR